MRIAIISRSGPCFPNIISQGFADALDKVGIEYKVFHEGIPMLMRLLPLSQKPKHWHNNLHFRIRNKLKYYLQDKKLLNELNQYDAVVLAECYQNLFWKNFFAIDQFKNLYKGMLISYTDCPLDAAPIHKARYIDQNDNTETIFDFNLFVTNMVERRIELTSKQAAFGINIAYNPLLKPQPKEEFIAIVDFVQPGYELYREQQIQTLQKLGIKTIILEGRYPIEEIRKIYSKASVFFLAFPETFGLPIAECLACGTYIFTPNSCWPMAWRLDENPMPMANGLLPDCFKVYQDTKNLEEILIDLRNNYHPIESPIKVLDLFKQHYNHFFEGNEKAVNVVVEAISTKSK